MKEEIKEILRGCRGKFLRIELRSIQIKKEGYLEEGCWPLDINSEADGLIVLRRDQTMKGISQCFIYSEISKIEIHLDQNNWEQLYPLLINTNCTN